MQVLCYTQHVRSCYTYNHLIHWVSIDAVVSYRQSLEQKQVAASEEEQQEYKDEEEQEKMELEQEQNRERWRSRSRMGGRGHN